MYNSSYVPFVEVSRSLPLILSFLVLVLLILISKCRPLPRKEKKSIKWHHVAFNESHISERATAEWSSSDYGKNKTRVTQLANHNNINDAMNQSKLDQKNTRARNPCQARERHRIGDSEGGKCMQLVCHGHFTSCIFGLVHTTPEKFESAALFLQLGLLSIKICHENGAS